MKFEAQLGAETITVEVTGAGGRFTVIVDGTPHEVNARQAAEGIWSLLLASTSYAADVSERNGAFVVEVEGERYQIRVEEETRYIIRTRGAKALHAGQVIKAPMPGKVILVEVTVGQTVNPGDGLVVLEAMKMENEFRASVAGTVKEVRVQAGQAVNPGDVLIVIE